MLIALITCRKKKCLQHFWGVSEYFLGHELKKKISWFPQQASLYPGLSFFGAITRRGFQKADSPRHCHIDESLHCLHDPPWIKVKTKHISIYLFCTRIWNYRINKLILVQNMPPVKVLEWLCTLVSAIRISQMPNMCTVKRITVRSLIMYFIYFSTFKKNLIILANTIVFLRT